MFRVNVVGNGGLNKTGGGREEEGKGGKDLFKIGVVGNVSLNKTEGRREEGRKKEIKFVQGLCCWQRGPEQDGGREGRRLSVVSNET